MYYPEELVEEIRSKNDIVDVISSYVRLQKKGSSYFGLCPFHNEKSPSFSVSRQKQMYYCFGKVEGNSATIEGVEKLSGARVSAPDLRAGAALCIAGLATDGITIVDDIVYIQRGYERFEEKIRGIGGIIERVSTEREIQKFKLKVS